MRVQTSIRTHKAHKSLYVHKSLVSFSIALFLPLYIYPKYKRVLERTMSFVQSAFFVIVYVCTLISETFERTQKINIYLLIIRISLVDALGIEKFQVCCDLNY